MTHRVVNGFLAGLLVVCSILVWNLEPDVTRPNVQFIPEMHYSIPYGAQSANEFMPDGKTLQDPPSGTIARGFLPLRYRPDETGRRQAGRELVNPVHEDSADAMDRGALIYMRICQPCHGSTGAGDGIVTKYGFPPPPSFASPTVRSLLDGEIFHTVTYGKGNMPSLSGQVARADRWNVILKVRSLQKNLLRKQRVQPSAMATGG